MADQHQNGDTHLSKRTKLSYITDEEIEAEFSHHDPEVARLNNGAFGCCPASVLAAQRQWQLKNLRQPDHFYFNDLKSNLLRSRSIIKELVNAEHVDEISLVDNASTATAIVLQQASWAFHDGTFGKGDAVLVLHHAYGAVKKALEAYVARAGGAIIEVPLPFPLTSENDVVREFRKAVEIGKSESQGGDEENGTANRTRNRIRLAVIDHVTSMPSVVIPVKELVSICREEGVDQVFVDAAHAIGCTRVDMQEIGADFYTSNLHKWFFCPPSVAFLYARRSSKSRDLHHPVVSHEYGNGIAVESSWAGNRDYSAQLVVPAAVDFVNRFEGGIEGIRKRNHDVVVEMGNMLVEAWGTHLGCPPHMSASMVMVGLPPSLGISSDSDALKLRTRLRDHFGVEVPIFFRGPADDHRSVTAYARISRQVYNKVADYYKFRDAVNQLLQDGFTSTAS
ncbi:hypothetical protein Fmac_024693 [Flemingia macrophylla]|uniref:Aminotransferase class V domain-containing protein n=1 Tax=Flemingia macrophylla TaxID=520843 RepID=A0ABD1LQ36_9FABA